MNTLKHAYDRFRGSCQRIRLSLTILEIVNPVAVVQLSEITLLVSHARENCLSDPRGGYPQGLPSHLPYVKSATMSRPSVSRASRKMRSRVEFDVRSAEGTEATTAYLLINGAFNRRATSTTTDLLAVVYPGLRKEGFFRVIQICGWRGDV